MSLKAKDVVYAKRDGINIYQEPVKNELVWKMTKTGQKQKYFDWTTAARIGTATGQIATTSEGTFVQVNCELVWWRKRLVDSVRENKTGYLLVSEDSFYYWEGLSNPNADAPKNDPVPDTPAPAPGAGGAGTPAPGGGTDNTNTIIWVLVAVLGLVAGFLGFKRITKGKK